MRWVERAIASSIPASGPCLRPAVTSTPCNISPTEETRSAHTTGNPTRQRNAIARLVSKLLYLCSKQLLWMNPLEDLTHTHTPQHTHTHTSSRVSLTTCGTPWMSTPTMGHRIDNDRHGEARRWYSLFACFAWAITTLEMLYNPSAPLSFSWSL
jgi:hypothetical protein